MPRRQSGHGDGLRGSGGRRGLRVRRQREQEGNGVQEPHGASSSTARAGAGSLCAALSGVPQRLQNAASRSFSVSHFAQRWPSLGALARQAASAEGYRLSADAAPELVRFIRSDQFSFIKRGIPALVLGTGYQPRDPSVDLDSLRREFLATHYHQPSDDLALPMDYPTAADLARINLRIALAAANASAAPRWAHGDFFAEKFPPRR